MLCTSDLNNVQDSGWTLETHLGLLCHHSRVQLHSMLQVI